ncbi:unnamed protein product [Penicillium salamii]|uniref:UBL3-like ubiquitin domain-containing protein n=1 Tax=Penicillium salamii TaxID=1612424 RepID=A0A9W4I6H9_9EURO|nr:unnamed protein product [Penicillium salamii]CAG8202393.1 unnamed protein product [Penicillium salamii]CAG8244083.1 unnamed protein product [Penicillium salamii]CAG8267612.1 unnamed protein product [Penicillium salamii]CAG8378128.1 unnamed protein product [Penicillium salamii]
MSTGTPESSHPKPDQPTQSPEPKPIAPTEPSTQPGLTADASTPSVEPLELTGDTVAPKHSHPATGPGGESAAPVTATTNPNSSAQVASTSPSMDTEEPKNVPEMSSEHSDDGSGKEVENNGPSLVITLLLTTGSRHPFTIDGKYLQKRSVNVENNDPFLMSVYTLKELIWREWRSDWETRPSSPSAIRLISFGKLLDDKSPLSDSKFSKEHPNVVHMTVKPQEVVDEEDAKGTKAPYNRENEASERSPGCRCVIL